MILLFDSNLNRVSFVDRGSNIIHKLTQLTKKEEKGYFSLIYI